METTSPDQAPDVAASEGEGGATHVLKLRSRCGDPGRGETNVSGPGKPRKRKFFERIFQNFGIQFLVIFGSFSAAPGAQILPKCGPRT